MATSAVKLSVMLAIMPKKTLPVDIKTPLNKYAAKNFNERDAKDAEEDLRAVHELRATLDKHADSSDARKDMLAKYYRCLCATESRFPIGPDKDQIPVYFTWYDSFKPSKQGWQANINFEKASILFNLAAVLSQQGLAADRSESAGVKVACNAYQSAAGVFGYLRDHVSMKASVVYGKQSSTVDVGVEAAGMLERLMLAQAQECFYEKAVVDKRPAELCAKIGRQAAMFYEEAFAALMLPPLSGHMDKSWVAHVQGKATYFQADALIRLAMHLHEKEVIGEEIARLKKASSIINDGKRNLKGTASNVLLDSLAQLESQVKRMLEVAEKENDRVYLMRVPHGDSLPPLEGAALARPMSPEEMLDASKEGLFTGLVPDRSAKALSKYTAMVDDVIRRATDRLQAESDLSKARLREMEVPELLAALDGQGQQLPPDVYDDVEAVQVDAGAGGLASHLSQIADLRRVNNELLVQVDEMLEAEAREDNQVRGQFGSRWVRPQSLTLTKSLKDRAASFAANLKQAGDSDTKIEKAVKDNEAMLAVLQCRPIESALPRLSKPILALHGNEQEIAARLRHLLGELERAASQRAGLEDLLKDMKNKDDILPQLMSSGITADELFKREIAKYNPVVEQVEGNIRQQKELLQQLQVQYDLFIRAFNVNDYKAAKHKAVQNIKAAVSKYREVRDNMNEGLKFYIALQDAITSLKQQCSDFVYTRNIQRQEMITDLQRQITGLSISSQPSHPSPVQYPTPGHLPPQHQHQQQQQQQQQQQGGNPVGSFFQMLMPGRPNQGGPMGGPSPQMGGAPPPHSAPRSGDAPPLYYPPQGSIPPGGGYYVPPGTGQYGQQQGGQWQGQPPQGGAPPQGGYPGQGGYYPQ